MAHRPTSVPAEGKAVAPAAEIACGAEGVPPRVLSYATDVDGTAPETGWWIAWWIGLIWCLGILLTDGMAVYPALTEIIAGPGSVENSLAWLQALLLAPAAAVLALTLLMSRFGRVSKRQLVVVAVITAVVFVAGAPAHVIRSWYMPDTHTATSVIRGWTHSDPLDLLLAEATRSMWIAGQWIALLVLLWALLIPNSATPRRLVKVAVLVVLAQPVLYTINLVQFVLETRGAAYYPTRPSTIFEHAMTAMHIVAVLMIALALRERPPRVAVLRCAALAFATAMLLLHVRPFIIWRSAGLWEVVLLIRNDLILATPALPLLLWPRHAWGSYDN